MELIQKTPGVALTPTAWEFDNPRFKKTDPGPTKMESKVTPVKVAHGRPESSGVDTVKFEDKVEINNNSSHDEREDLVVEEQKDQQINNPEEKKFDNSFNSDSTIELLAEIDHALRNSLVSPLLDQSPPGGPPNVDTSPRSQQSNLARTLDPAELMQPYKSHFRTDKDKGETMKTPVAVITGVKSPDSKKSLRRTQSMPSHTTLQPQYNKSPGLRSKLSGRGIETLPSPRDPQRVTPRSKSAVENEKTRQRLFSDDERGLKNAKSRMGDDRGHTTPEKDSSSGVIVSTSFAEYLTSHGISIPDIIVSPNRRSPSRNDRTDRSYEADVSSLYHVESMSKQRHSQDKKYTDSDDGQHYSQKQQDQLNSSYRTPTYVEKLNQRNIQVQSDFHHSTQNTCPRQIRQLGNRTNVPETLSSSGSERRGIHPNSSSQLTTNGGSVGRPTPIGQNHESHSRSASQTLSRSELIQQHQDTTPVSSVKESGRTQSQSVVYSASQENSTPIATVVQPNQHSIPRAFTKESLGRSGVYPSYQLSTSIQSPIMKETLHDSQINQGSPNLSQNVRRHSYQGLPQHDRSTGGDGDSLRKRPSLQISLAGTETEEKHVPNTLEMAKDRLSGVAHHHTAISRAK